MSEQQAKVLVTIVCYDCTPEEAAEKMADHPQDLTWSTTKHGEFEIIDAAVAPS